MTESELLQAYNQAKHEAREWKRDFTEFERLANNELLDDLDENLPETNDGSLAASLFKLPKRIVPNDLTGTPRALDRNDKWINEFAKIEWEKNIVPNANTQAPFQLKWKDAVRKAAIYGSVPLVTLLTEQRDGTTADFIVAYPQDVTLEPGKVSDYDSDVIYWDVYFTDTQIERLIEEYKAEEKLAREEQRESQNTWKLDGLKALKDATAEVDRDSEDQPRTLDQKPVKKGGKKVVMCFKRGVGSTFTGYAPGINQIVREYDNPDPTGDIPVHYLYCYQDFINPYGIGIVKLAGGTQNVLDYMRQADVLATQIGIRPPILLSGDLSQTDLESFTYGQDLLWLAGNAQVARQELGNQVYQQLPNRISMYKTSLNQLIPTGDTSISAEAGDPSYSKTPAGVKFQQQSLSVDDEDFKDKLFITYSAVAKSMINTHFANKQGTDIMQLSETERERIFKSDPDMFPMFTEQVDPMTGEVIPPSEELEVVWDEARATFDFEVDPEPEKVADEQQKIEGALKVLELVNADPNIIPEMEMSGKRFNKGELLSELIGLLSDNDKIITDISPDEQQAAQEQMQQEQMMQPGMEQGQEEPQEEYPGQIEAETNIQAVMEEYGVDEMTAVAMLEAERKGFSKEQIDAYLQSQGEQDAEL